MKKSILRASAGFQAIALLGAGSAAFIAAAPAAAQDYTSGAIIGTITNDSGAPIAGATVTLRSVDQNQTRSFVTNSAGSFTASGLSAGAYEISVAANGYQPYTDSLNITAAQSSQVTVGLVSVGQTSTIVVTGRRLRQTASQGTTGLNLDVTAVNTNAPVGHDITSLTLLAPTTAVGVRNFRQANGEDVPSIGGGSVAENAYYINGLNITNPDTYVGSARVPFYFYKTVDIQTGGYAAEFGRATGGVINATSKSGANDPFIALHIDWEPKSLQSHSPNTGNPNNPTIVGRDETRERKSLTIEAGGAIIPDHLFAYGLIQANRDTQTLGRPTAGYYGIIKNNDPFWGGKIDAYINPTQHFEFTIFDTRSKAVESRYAFTHNADYTNLTRGAFSGKRVIETGGLNWVARYTGNVTDWITLSGAYGVNKDDGNFIPGDSDAYLVIDRRTATVGGVATTISKQTFATTNIASTKRRFYRGDADVRFTAAGQHHVRFGFDNEDLSETKTTSLSGGLPIQYDYRNAGVLFTYEVLGGNVSATDTSFYIQDSWSTPLEGLTLNLGIRNDIFKQTNLSGEQYLKLKGNWGPRLAFNYAPPSLENWRFFGSFGRYFIPPAMNLGFRGKDLYFQEFFAYPEGYTAATFPVDPVTGLPLVPLGGPITGPGFPSAACPVNFSEAPGNPTNTGEAACAIYGGGVQNPALAKVIPGTKATSEDEFILGTRYRASPLLSFGVQGTYRKLNNVSEDSDFRNFLADYFCSDAHSDETRCDFYTNNSAYYIWNPGSSTVTLNDWYSALNGEVLPVTLNNIPFPKGKRTYKALVFDFNRADDGRWLASGSITWSKSKGNTEGTVKSDAGNAAQVDAGSTADFDYPGLTDYGYGLLPNDHRWVFKLFGAYHFGKMFTLGANILVQSPMHGSCFGIHPTDPDAANYRAASRYCGTTLNSDGAYVGNTPSPRGTAWKSQWLKQIDLSARFNIPYGNDDANKLVLRADVFNVFNSKAITQRYAAQQTGPGTVPGTFAANPLYLTPFYYQTPRSVRLGLDLMFGGRSAPRVEEEAAPPPPPPAPEAPATQTCADGSVILATDACPQPAAPPPPPPPPASSGERGQ